MRELGVTRDNKKIFGFIVSFYYIAFSNCKIIV